MPAPASSDSHGTPLPGGADSYLIIVSTFMLPCLLIGLLLRNYVYTHTVATRPGAFFVLVASIHALACLLLLTMPRATDGAACPARPRRHRST